LGSLIEKALVPPERSPMDEMVAKAARELERLKAEKQHLLSLTLKGVFSEEEVATEARRIDAENAELEHPGEQGPAAESAPIRRKRA
jgi:hypothetical protein